jgi:hypothetical protein
MNSMNSKEEERLYSHLQEENDMINMYDLSIEKIKNKKQLIRK